MSCTRWMNSNVRLGCPLPSTELTDHQILWPLLENSSAQLCFYFLPLLEPKWPTSNIPLPEAPRSAAPPPEGERTGFNVLVYLYISIIFGFSLMPNVWILFRISGGLFNPAVALGMVSLEPFQSCGRCFYSLPKSPEVALHQLWFSVYSPQP